jgi:hypothetical protein
VVSGTGMCPALLHGLDHEGQACDLCAAMNARAKRVQFEHEHAQKKFTDKAYCVACPECSADPLEGCIAVNGGERSCKLHGKREARANGLKATPRRGHYQRPKVPIQFTDAELQAFRLLGHEIPK